MNRDDALLANEGSQLAELLRSEREFSSNASHQLRSPLTALRLRIENLRPHAEEELAAVSEIGFAYFMQGKYDQAAIVFEGLVALQPRLLVRSGKLWGPYQPGAPQ